MSQDDKLREALQFFADGGTYEDGGNVRRVPWPLQVRAREALAAARSEGGEGTPRRPFGNRP
jgi:hypothetical protein